MAWHSPFASQRSAYGAAHTRTELHCADHCILTARATRTGMDANHSVEFFELQFRRQACADAGALNPFEERVLPWLSGHVLELGCGLGHLALAAARRGCRVLALDASATAIAHLEAAARREGLAVEARCADLDVYRPDEDFDALVSIGLLMFFAPDAGRAMLARMRERVRPGGVLAVNLLIEGTTWTAPFAPERTWLPAPSEVEAGFAGWEILGRWTDRFPVDGGTEKRFLTLLARRAAG